MKFLKDIFLFTLLVVTAAAQTVITGSPIDAGGVSPAPAAGGPATFSSITDTGLTATRVTFAGTGGLLTDDAGFTFATSGKMLTLLNNTTNPGVLGGTIFHVIGADGVSPRIQGSGFGNLIGGLTLTGRAANGTAASPTDTVAAQSLVQLTGRGRANGAYPAADAGLLGILALNAWSVSDTSTQLFLSLTPSGSTTTTSGVVIINTVTATFLPAITSASSIKSTSPSAGIGYNTGAGAAITQATSRSTPVTINAVSGTITGNATSLVALTSATFTVNNTSVAIGDVIILSVQSGPTTSGTKVDVSRVAANAFDITIYNANTITADVGAPLINFAVIKAVSN